jgi:hypothetical protein
MEKMEKTTVVEAVAAVEQIEGNCPKCGGPLTLEDHVCARNPDGSPSEEDTFLTPYCSKCEIFWVPFHARREMRR